jgi:Domain of unknown function (DUF4743)
MSKVLVAMALSLLWNSFPSLTLRTGGKSASLLLSAPTIAQLMQRVEENNISKDRLGNLIPFNIGTSQYGYLNSAFASHLVAFDRVLDVSRSAETGMITAVGLKQHLVDGPADARTEAMAEVTAQLRDQGVIKGWRNELVPCVKSFSDPPALLIERAAYSFFGLKGYGVHLNGFVRDVTTNRISHLWVATRSKTKSTWPGMLDHIVAGGQPFGISATDNVVKECGEEANISPELASQAICAGAVSYVSIDELGQLKQDSLFCFDLELPSDFVPTPVDGEVEKFELRPMDWVIDRVAKGGPEGYKPNCNLVVIDFLIRHGIISCDSPNYLQLLAALRRPSSS